MASPLPVLVIYLYFLAFSIAMINSPVSAAETSNAFQDALSALQPEEKDGDKMNSGFDASDLHEENEVTLQPSANADQPDLDEPEQAAYPGVENRRVKKTAPNEPEINIFYPVLGSLTVDEKIKLMVDETVKDFTSEYRPADDATDREQPDNIDQWQLTGSYALQKPSPDIVSITFNFYSFTGGAHGNLLLNCLNFNLATGKQLEFDDIFGDSQKALAILSEITAQKLRVELGEDADEEMIRDGTEPTAENFKNLSLAPSEVIVEFQPYQVGPWSVGPQHIPVSLTELEPAKPSSVIWPSVVDEPPQDDASPTDP